MDERIEFTIRNTAPFNSLCTYEWTFKIGDFVVFYESHAFILYDS